jgi:beta-glucosidase
MANRTYRYFKGKPLFAFGDGLSYTRFSYSNIVLSTKNLRAGDTLTVEAEVKNVGATAGDEVSELYLAHTTDFPVLALAGFERFHLAPCEVKHALFHLDPRTLSEVEANGVRAVRAGEDRIYVGGSQPSGDAADLVRSQGFTVAGTEQLAR